MAGPINNLPLGYLDFLGLRTHGIYPQQAADVIAPTIDITPLIAQASAEFLLLQDTFTGAGTRSSGVFYWPQPEAVVPANEVWWCQAFHTSMVLTGVGAEAGSGHLMGSIPGQAALTPFWRPPALTPYGLRTYNALDEMFTGNATGVHFLIETSAHPFLIPPGMRLGYVITHLAWTAAAAESVQINTALQIVRMRR